MKTPFYTISIEKSNGAVWPDQLEENVPGCYEELPADAASWSPDCC